jgi:hypothetical protein
MNKSCICIVSRVVNIEWLKFLSKFNNYDVYIVADDNSQDYKEKYKEFSKVKIIQFDDEECEKAGFAGLTKGIEPTSIMEGKKGKSVWAWDKAFYYFAIKNKSYENMWLIEEDVYVYDEMSFIYLDKKNIGIDLVSPTISQDFVDAGSNEYYPNGWWWRKICVVNKGMKYESPDFLRCLAFHVRVSKKMIEKIKEYVGLYGCLFFHEACLPMICKMNNLSFSNPDELSISIPCRELPESRKDGILSFRKYYFFHPIKNLERHEKYRLICSDMNNTD